MEAKELAMKPPYYKAVCPHDDTPVNQQADFTYHCSHCGRTIPPNELKWIKIDKEETHEE
jgi:hypothetical protein